jgi:hypothetical protein
MKASPKEEGRIIAQSQFDVNEEIHLSRNSSHDDARSEEFLTSS